MYSQNVRLISFIWSNSREIGEEKGALANFIKQVHENLELKILCAFMLNYFMNILYQLSKNPNIFSFFLSTHEVEDEETTWLKHMERQFKEIAGEDGTIDLQEFKRALKVKDVSTA